jgi:transcriptional regulator of acetoin/glycerol metabolism
VAGERPRTAQPDRAGRSIGAGPWITPGDLFPDRCRRGNSAEPQAASLESIRDEAERREILNALRRKDGVIGKAATALGISRTTMWEKMRRHRIEAIKLD